jgi:hypothetical protein
MAAPLLRTVWPERVFPPAGVCKFGQVARWRAGSKVESASGVFQAREDEPVSRGGAGLHRTPLGRAEWPHQQPPVIGTETDQMRFLA